jgi:hypothetical protein
MATAEFFTRIHVMPALALSGIFSHTTATAPLLSAWPMNV